MRHRLWFRLQQVLPLAEHTLACYAHRLTGAQVQVRAACGPALIWTSTPAGGHLTSNGIPEWYLPGGDENTADASEWHDRTGRHGGTRLGDYTSAYLPLADPRVVDLLHLARIAGRTWVAIDVDPAGERLIRTDQIRAVAGRHDLAPAGARWIPATVTCHDVDNQPYPALIADGYTSSSGALLARFDPLTIRRMIDDLAVVHNNVDRTTDTMPGEYPLLELRGRELFVWDAEDTGDNVIWHLSDRVTPGPGGLYPLGAYVWPWRLVDRPTGWRAIAARWRYRRHHDGRTGR